VKIQAEASWVVMPRGVAG